MKKTILRMLTERGQRIAELEGTLVSLCEKNRAMLEAADQQIQRLSARIGELEDVSSFVSGKTVSLRRNVTFGKGPLDRILKKAAIGASVRSIRALDWASNSLRRFVNWTCVR